MICQRLQGEFGTVQDPSDVIPPSGSLTRTRYVVPAAPRLFGQSSAMAVPVSSAVARISCGITTPFSVSGALSKKRITPFAITDPSGRIALQVTGTVVMIVIVCHFGSGIKKPPGGGCVSSEMRDCSENDERLGSCCSRRDRVDLVSRN